MKDRRRRPGVRGMARLAFRRRVMTKGVRGGQRSWLVLGGLAWSFGLARRLWQREPEVVYRTELVPGETFTVVTAAPPTRRQARRARKAAKGIGGDAPARTRAARRGRRRPPTPNDPS